MSKKLMKVFLILLIASVIALFLMFDLNQYLSLASIKEKQTDLAMYYQNNSVLVSFVFAFIYISVTAFSLPISTILTLLGGALFGFVHGLIIISFSSTIGATLAFLMARNLFRDWVQKNHGVYLTKINKGFEKEGAFYLFALRLVPIFPFFLVNLVSSLLPIKTWTFYWVSQVGMLAGTVVYVFAGTQLGKLTSLSGILSPKLLFTFTVLGLFPILSKKAIFLMRKGKTQYE